MLVQKEHKRRHDNVARYTVYTGAFVEILT